MKKNEFVIEYTEADIEEMRTQGIDEDAIPSIGEHVFRRVTPERLASRRDSKVRINIYIDLDVLSHFRRRAEAPNAAPYQTQINAELRNVMKRDLSREEIEVDETARRLLEDDDFLETLSRKLKEKDLKVA